MKRVLLVNNNKELEGVLETLLKLKGFESRSTQSSKDLVKIISEYRPEVIILNLMMANRNPIEICEDIRSIGLFNCIKLILFGSSKHFKRKLRNMNVLGFLSSPFAVDDLLYLLQ